MFAVGRFTLPARDLREVRAMRRELDTLQLGGPPVMERIADQLRAVLGVADVWSYAPVQRDDGTWSVERWARSGGDGRPEVAEAFRTTLGTLRGDYAWFRPTLPDVAQRNRVIEALEAVQRARPGYFESTELYARFFVPMKLERHRQLRVILCDGPVMLGMVTAFHPDPVDARQHAILRALVPSLRRRLITERTLRDPTDHALVLETVLAHLGIAAFVVGARGQLHHANELGRAALAADRAGTARVLGAAAAGRALPDHVALPIAGSSPATLVVGRAPRALGHRLGHAAVRWSLTPRQRAVLELVAGGHANAAIAAQLGITVRTVELHVTALLQRAGVDSRAALVAQALL